MANLFDIALRKSLSKVLGILIVSAATIEGLSAHSRCLTDNGKDVACSAIRTEALPSVAEEDAPRQLSVALKTNMLYDVALVPNLGVELFWGNDWSVAGNWMYAWWDNDGSHKYWRTYGGDVEVRRWFGSKRPFNGHHVGVYAQMLTYDFERGGRGYLGDKWSYGGGVSYGYSLPIFKCLNIDFAIGVGYIRGKYKEYLPMDGEYVWQSTKMRSQVIPTKIEVSLVWFLGKTGSSARKGGGL